jgi:hypothetical protein
MLVYWTRSGTVRPSSAASDRAAHSISSGVPSARPLSSVAAGFGSGVGEIESRETLSRGGRRLACRAAVMATAVAAYAGEREAHLREVERYGESLPEGSYGRQNRQAIAARERRIATRLRAVGQAYRMAVERDAEISSPQAARTLRTSERAADREIEME